MRWHELFSSLVVLGVFAMGPGCSDREESPRAVAQEQPPADPEGAPATTTPGEATPAMTQTENEAPEPLPPPTPAPRAEAAAQPAPVPTEVKTPDAQPAPEPAPPAEALRPPAQEPPLQEPPPSPPPVDASAGEVVAVPATKSGLTYIGATKCKMCHKVQYESWSTSAHAKRTPPLDCESCHGPGSEYKKASIMKDPALAEAAGLVMPKESFCTSACHQQGWTDDMLTKAHAHKNDVP